MELTKEQQIAAFDHAMNEFLEIHDHRIIFETLEQVVHLIDLMDLKGAQKMEFYEPTPKGRIQKEARDKTLSIIKGYLINEMANQAKAMEENADTWKDFIERETDS